MVTIGKEEQEDGFILHLGGGNGLQGVGDRNRPPSSKSSTFWTKRGLQYSVVHLFMNTICFSKMIIS